MRDSHHIWLFEIPPGIPHAIVNTSEKSSGTIVEFADGEPQSVEYYPISLDENYPNRVQSLHN